MVQGAIVNVIFCSCNVLFKKLFDHILNSWQHLSEHTLAFKLPSSYRIQNCFSTISTKILVNRYYFRNLWRILACKSLLITHIFAIYSDLSVVSIVMVISAKPNHQFWWFLVWFICRITNFFANSSDFHGDYICFLPVLLPNLVIIFIGPESDHCVMLVSDWLTP